MAITSLLNRIGKKTAIPVALGLVAGNGLASGVRGQGASSVVYDTLLGDPDADKNVLGYDLTLREALLPMPGGPIWSMQNGPTVGGKLAGSISMGAINTKSIGDYVRYNSNGGMNLNQYQNRNFKPQIDGQMVIGLYNSRMG